MKILLTMSVLAAGALQAQLPEPPADYEARAAAIVKSYADDGQFQGMVLVKSKDRVIFQRSYGMADAEWKTPFTATTRFRIGSMTKHFTAAAILQLEEKALLSVNDPIQRYYPEAPAEWTPITIEHLLRHTSGIFNYFDLPGFNLRQARTPAEVIAATHEKPLAFEPGTRYSYSNTGYFLLGLIVERVAGTSWDKYVRENILRKAGLDNTGYDRTERLSPNRAAGYQGDALRLFNADFFDMSLAYAAGALYSTPEDFVKWLEALDSGKIISQRSWQKMMTAGLNDQGYGVQRQRFLFSECYTHSGSIPGFTTNFIRCAADGLTIIAFANVFGDAAVPMCDRLMRLTANQAVGPVTVRATATWETRDLQAVAGTYSVSGGGTVRIVLEDDGLVLSDSRLFSIPIPLHPRGTDQLFARTLQILLTASREGGAVNRLQYRFGNLPDPLGNRTFELERVAEGAKPEPSMRRSELWRPVF